MSTVSPGGAPDRERALAEMFGRIAPNYDLMNAIMSVGLDRRWRRRAAEAAAIAPGDCALDIGTGTGDLAIELARNSPGSRVFGLDLSASMIGFAPSKAAGKVVADRTSWLRGDCLALPFGDETFDAVVSAFLLRNVADLGAGFAEMKRVVRRGGRVVSLEMSPNGAPLWRTAFQLYFHGLVPWLGRIVARDGSAYEYLPSSVAAFLAPEAVSSLMVDAGLAPRQPLRLVMGTVLIHTGVREG